MNRFTKTFLMTTVASASALFVLSNSALAAKRGREKIKSSDAAAQTAPAGDEGAKITEKEALGVVAETNATVTREAKSDAHHAEEQSDMEKIFAQEPARKIAIAEKHEEKNERRPDLFPEVIPTIHGRFHAPTTKNPAWLHIMIDGSNSMNEPFGNGVGTKAMAVREAVNSTLADVVKANYDDGVFKDRLKITGESYDSAQQNSGAQLAPLFSARAEDVVSVGELAARAPNGQADWVKAPLARGWTPMRGVFAEMANRVQGQDVAEKLVMVVHVTDGKSTDGDPLGEMGRLGKTIADKGGQPLFTQVFISSDRAAKPIMFPSDAEAAEISARDPQFAMLYKAASVMPEHVARGLGYRESEGRRMLAFNVRDLDQLKAIFRAGSSSAAGW